MMRVVSKAPALPVPLIALNDTFVFSLHPQTNYFWMIQTWLLLTHPNQKFNFNPTKEKYISHGGRIYYDYFIAYIGM